jgi:hypothetical protein
LINWTQALKHWRRKGFSNPDQGLEKRIQSSGKHIERQIKAQLREAAEQQEKPAKVVPMKRRKAK